MQCACAVTHRVTNNILSIYALKRFLIVDRSAALTEGSLANSSNKFAITMNTFSNCPLHICVLCSSLLLKNINTKSNRAILEMLSNIWTANSESSLHRFQCGAQTTAYGSACLCSAETMDIRISLSKPLVRNMTGKLAGSVIWRGQQANKRDRQLSRTFKNA